LSTAQIVRFRDCLVPQNPVQRLVDAAPVLVVDANSSVIPLTHEVNPALWLGAMTDAPLSALARDWLAGDLANQLARACEDTWEDLTAASPTDVVYWYEEVAKRTFDVARTCRLISLQRIT